MFWISFAKSFWAEIESIAERLMEICGDFWVSHHSLGRSFSRIELHEVGVGNISRRSKQEHTLSNAVEQERG